MKKRVVLLIDDKFDELGMTAAELQVGLQQVIDQGEGTDDGTPNIVVTLESAEIPARNA